MDEMEKMKQELTEGALAMARQFGTELDYSHRSIEDIDRILGMVHQHFKDTEKENGFDGIAMCFAAYIISVIERHLGPGVWTRDHETLGNETFPFTWAGGTIFPYAWCMKRMIDGPQDDVWLKYKTLILAKANAANGE